MRVLFTKITLYYYHNICFHFSVLKTFLHDPLVEWSKPVKGHSKAPLNETGEVVNEKVSRRCSLIWTDIVYLYKWELILNTVSDWPLNTLKFSSLSSMTMPYVFFIVITNVNILIISIVKTEFNTCLFNHKQIRVMI